jgi:integrase
MPRKTTRRGNHEGSVYQRQDGNWCGQVTIGYKPDGRPNRKTFYGKTREAVAEKVTNAASDAFKGVVFTEPQNMTVAQLVNDWLFNFKRSEVTARTFEWYLNIAKTHIYADLGGMPLKKLTIFHIQNLLNSRIANGTGLRTLKVIQSALNQALQHAVEMNLLASNPANGVKLPKAERKVEDDSKFFSPQLRKQILEAVEGEELMKAAVVALFFTGVRSGELLALPWKNVDFKNSALTIDRAITQESAYETDGTRTSRETVVSVPKTYSGNRKFKIPPVVLDALREWKKIRYFGENSPVFANREGKNYTYGGFRSMHRYFQKRRGLPAFSLHSYRHNLASMLLEQGVNPKVVQKILGHADVRMSLYYSHTSAEVCDAAADTLEDVYEKTLDGNYKTKAGA